MRSHSVGEPKFAAASIGILVQQIHQGGEIDIQGLVAVAWAGKWWIAASAALFTVIFGVIAILTPPTYRASAVLVPASSTEGIGGDIGSTMGSLGGLAALAGFDFGSRRSRVDEALAVLQSREFLQKFITENNLMPLFFEEQWDPVAGKWKDPEHEPTLAKAHKYFINEVLSIDEDKESALITVHIDWRDREQAAEWANDLVAKLNAEMRSRAAEKAAASMRFLEAEMKRTDLVGTQEAIGRLMESQINQGMLANVTEEYVFRIVDRAMPPDEDDPAKPKKVLLIAAGFMLGIVLGVLGVLAAKAASWLRVPGAARAPVREGA